MESTHRVLARNQSNLKGIDMTRMKIFLAFTVIVGYFGVLCLYGMGEIVVDGSNQPILILVGGLASAFGAIISWYFGSSEGSSRKTDLLTKKETP